RAPNRELVRRTPFATARTRPLRRVNTVTIRSASPSFWVRSTTPSSRYRLTPPLCRLSAPAVHGGAVRGRDHRPQRRGDDVRVDTDAPDDLVLDLALHVCRSLCVPAGGQRVLGVVQHPNVAVHPSYGVDERGHRAVALAPERVHLVAYPDVDDQLVQAVLRRRGVPRLPRARPGPRPARGVERCIAPPGGPPPRPPLGEPLHPPAALDVQSPGQPQVVLPLHAVRATPPPGLTVPPDHCLTGPGDI